MKVLRRYLGLVGAAVALWAPLSAAAEEAQGMCAALNRIAAAAREPAPFASLEPAARVGTLVPGFRDGDCTVTAGERVHCYRNIAPAHLELAEMERLLADCLGGTPVWRSGPRDMYRERDIAFVAAGLRYEVHNACDRSCRAGLLASFDISLVGAPERRR